MVRRQDLTLGACGLALLRNWLVGDEASSDRIVAEMRAVLDNPTEHLVAEVPVPEHGLRDGYAAWSATYDNPNNPIFLVDEPVIRALLAGLPAGRALDAACGSGRITRTLVECGHAVSGVDQSPEMLGVARRSLPDVAFSEGPLELLPFPDGTFDVVTCALALTHLRNLGPAMAEFRRVLKPGGHLVTADVHPMLATLSGQASFPGGWIRNEIHWPGAYFRAFREAGLRVEECVEPGYDEKGLLSWYGRFPISLETHRAAWEGIPAVLAWRAQAPF